MRWGLTLLACIASATIAETNKKWTQEPESILGIKLGVPLSGSPVLSCPEYAPSDEWRPPPKDVCIRGGDSPFGDPVRAVEGLPWTDMAISASVQLIEGKVESVRFELRHDAYPEFKEMLITRYGPPMKTEATEVTSYAGAVVNSETLLWIGETVTIALTERTGRIDRASANISHNTLAQKALEARDAEIKDAASKL